MQGVTLKNYEVIVIKECACHSISSLRKLETTSHLKTSIIWDKSHQKLKTFYLRFLPVSFPHPHPLFVK